MMTVKRLAMISLFLLVLFTTGCSSKPEKEACQIDTLLVDVSAFPDNIWEETGSRDTRGAPSRLGIERAGTSFSTATQGTANNDIYHFDTAFEAEENYSKLQLDWFNLAPEDSVWITPVELDSITLNADEYRLDCFQKNIEVCMFVARYHVYVVEFSTAMPVLTYNDFIRLLETIDQKMMGCLSPE